MTIIKIFSNANYLREVAECSLKPARFLNCASNKQFLREKCLIEAGDNYTVEMGIDLVAQLIVCARITKISRWIMCETRSSGH